MEPVCGKWPFRGFALSGAGDSDSVSTGGDSAFRLPLPEQEVGGGRKFSGLPEDRRAHQDSGSLHRLPGRGNLSQDLFLYPE